VTCRRWQCDDLGGRLDATKNEWRRAVLGSGDEHHRFQLVVAAQGGGLGGAAEWRQDIEAADESEV
jgi:hypothetical protein